MLQTLGCFKEAKLTKILKEPTADNVFVGKATDIDGLRCRLNLAKQRKQQYEVIAYLMPVSGALICLLMYGFYWLFGNGAVWASVGAFYLVLSLIFPLFPFGESVEREIEAIESELSHQLSGADAIEERAKRLFANHEIDLKKYYRQTLKHSKIIFLAGIMCICIGFAIIVATYYLVWHSGGLGELSEKIVASAFGLMSGILVNFIAVIYIRMFSNITDALTSFHQKLVVTNHLHFANFLVTKISDVEKRNDVLASIAKQISRVPDGGSK